MLSSELYRCLDFCNIPLLSPSHINKCMFSNIPGACSPVSFHLELPTARTHQISDPSKEAHERISPSHEFQKLGLLNLAIRLVGFLSSLQPTVESLGPKLKIVQRIIRKKAYLSDLEICDIAVAYELKRWADFWKEGSYYRARRG